MNTRRMPTTADSVMLGVIATALATGCSDPTAVREVGSTSQSVTVAIGTEFDVRLGTVGPGEYASPPAVSTPSVAAYLSVDADDPVVPAGARQRFRFRATARGATLITFRHTAMNPTIVDTVEVR